MSRAIIRVVVLLMASLIVIGAVAGLGPGRWWSAITQLTCVSSVGVATLTDVMPASTQVATLSAASGDVHSLPGRNRRRVHVAAVARAQ